MSKEPLLVVRNLRVLARSGRGAIVKGIDFALEEGECLALVGESGAGKSVAMKGVCGLLPPCLRAEGEVLINGREMLHLGYSRPDRGSGIFYLSQQPLTAFHPHLTLGAELRATLGRARRSIPRSEADARIKAELESLGIEDPAGFLRRHPNELSGGMLQRAMAAAALLLEPRLIVADEPTSALDAVSRREMFERLSELRRRTRAALVVVTHDLDFAAAIADRFIVMQAGEIVERGGNELLARPRHPLTKEFVRMRRLMQDAFEAALEGRAPSSRPGAPLLEVKHVSKSYRSARHAPFFGANRQAVLQDVDFVIRAGETVGLVGASGAGKSTLARLLLGFEHPDSGEIRMEGERLERWIASHPGSVSFVAQNCADALDPAWTIEQSLLEPVRLAIERADPDRRPALLALLSRPALIEALERMRLPAEVLERRPHQLSGGELQRAAILRAMMVPPKLLVFDEALSSLDAHAQGEVLEILRSIPKGNSAWLFISHDLKAVTAISSRVLFLEEGRVAESLETNRLCEARSAAARRFMEAASGLRRSDNA